MLRAKLKAKLAQKLKDAKLKAKKGLAGAINDMAAGATPEQVLNQMMEQLAKQLFDFEEFKAAFEKMVNDKIAEMEQRVNDEINGAIASATEPAASQLEKMKKAQENVIHMYVELEAVTKKIGKAFAALFDMTAALKPSDELMMMFGGDKASAFDEETMGLEGAAEMGKKFESLLKDVTGNMVGRLDSVQDQLDGMAGMCAFAISFELVKDSYRMPIMTCDMGTHIYPCPSAFGHALAGVYPT